MKLIKFILTMGLFANCFAQDKFCSSRSQHQQVKNLLLTKNNLIDFDNDAGLFNQGVCWWHSRLQRNSIYLAQFFPHLKKPSKTKIRKIIRKLIKGKKVTSIHGYKNFNEFTKEHRRYILKRLTLWQIKDGFLGFAWIRGLQGRSKLDAKALKVKMQKLYQYISSGNIAYTKLQLRGIPSHSWLMIDAQKSDRGIKFLTLDSNKPKKAVWYHYAFGEESFRYRSYGDFIPYLEQQKENKRLKKVLKKYCKKYSHSVATMH